MTQDEIIRMARDTGKTKWFGTHEDGTNDFLGVEFTPEQLERFANRVAEATKEKAAKVCEELHLIWDAKGANEQCAAAIKAMK